MTLSPLPSTSDKREEQAHALCLRLLTARSRTRSELSGQLAKRGYPEDVADSVLDRMISKSSIMLFDMDGKSPALPPV